VTSTVDILAYIPSPPQGVWYVGPVALRAYALFIIVGIVVAIVWGDRRWVARGGEKGTVLDIAIWAVPFGLIGGRLYHVMTDWPTYFGEGGDPVDALKVWQGGLGIWGAVALGGVGAWIGCRRRGIPLPALGDAVAPAILLAQAIGRLGNYFNQIFERRNDVGQVSPQLIDGVSTGEVAFVVHPTFLYEALWNVLIVLLLVWVDRRFRIGHGRLFALYVAGYCAGRFWIELMRSDHASLIAGVRVNSFTSALVFVAALVYFFAATKGREDPAELRPADGEPVDSETTEKEPEKNVEDEGTDEDAPASEPVSDDKAASTASTGGEARTKTIDSKKDDAND